MLLVSLKMLIIFWNKNSPTIIIQHVCCCALLYCGCGYSSITLHLQLPLLFSSMSNLKFLAALNLKWHWLSTVHPWIFSTILSLHFNYYVNAWIQEPMIWSSIESECRESILNSDQYLSSYSSYCRTQKWKHTNIKVFILFWINFWSDIWKYKNVG